jgi:hypothetical protein
MVGSAWLPLICSSDCGSSIPMLSFASGIRWEIWTLVGPRGTSTATDLREAARRRGALARSLAADAEHHLYFGLTPT